MNAETLAALGEPNRFRIVELLRHGPQSVNDIGFQTIDLPNAGAGAGVVLVPMGRVAAEDSAVEAPDR